MYKITRVSDNGRMSHTEFAEQREAVQEYSTGVMSACRNKEKILLSQLNGTALVILARANFTKSQ